jgi:succinate dehydrogenase flavin-adding protein (antitoxin of CptAB toxin-antitoxin module)
MKCFNSRYFDEMSEEALVELLETEDHNVFGWWKECSFLLPPP